MTKKKITLLKIENNNFPYRKLKDIYTLNEFYNLFTDSLFPEYDKEKYTRYKNYLARAVYYRYKERYPYIQDKETLDQWIIQTKDTVYDMFFSLINRHLKNDLDYEAGNESVYNTKAGTSASPYNISFNGAGEIREDDYLYEKRLSNTLQGVKKKDIVARSADIQVARLNGEVENFVATFSSLFSNFDIEEKVNYLLTKNLNLYYNNIVELQNNYFKLVEKINKLKVQQERET